MQAPLHQATKTFQPQKREKALQPLQEKVWQTKTPAKKKTALNKTKKVLRSSF